MFWNVILFIVIIFGAGVLRQWASNYGEEIGKEEIVKDLLALIIGSIIVTTGTVFYLAFAIKWGLNFLVGFNDLSYFQIVGLLYLYYFTLKRRK